MARGSRIPLPPTTSSRVVGITRTNHTNTMLHMQLSVARGGVAPKPGIMMWACLGRLCLDNVSLVSPDQLAMFYPTFKYVEARVLPALRMEPPVNSGHDVF